MYDDLLPDDPAEWLRARVKNVTWADDPKDQMSESLLLFIIALVSSAVTLGATIVLTFVFATTFTVGLSRLALSQVR